ncbi:MAG: helix-turn-helix transcriptional regulator [Arsenophonus sp.]|nr:helix-turn-helix transcriptional regulator [Arsenophonus sp.]
MAPKNMIEYLINSGLTQIQIQQKTGISQLSISRLLSGKNSDPRISVLKAIESLYLEAKNSKNAQVAASNTKAK